MTVPGMGFMKLRQFFRFRSSVVVLYRCAIVLRSSPTPTVMGVQPPGMVQAVGVPPRSNGVWVGANVGMSCAGNGEENSTANIVGIGDGVNGRDGADVSVKDSEIPPMTSKRDTAAMMNPLPNWRRAFMVRSPIPFRLLPWEAVR